MLGWFDHYHVDLHNRHDFCTHLEQLVTESGYNFNFTLYPRNVWERDRTERVKTCGLVVEANEDLSNKVVNCLLGLSYKGNYHGVSFNSFICMRSIGPGVMLKVYKASNIFLRNTVSTVIPSLQCSNEEFHYRPVRRHVWWTS